MSASRVPWVLAAAGIGFAAVGLFVWKKGGVAAAAQAAGGAIVETVGNVAAGGIGAVGSGVGLPAPDKTVRDQAVARWIIDNVGQWEASKWSSAMAYLLAQTMRPGTGTPPPPDSPAGREFAYYVSASQWQDYTDDETARLLARYPLQQPAQPAISYWSFARRPGEM